MITDGRQGTCLPRGATGEVSGGCRSVSRIVNNKSGRSDAETLTASAELRDAGNGFGWGGVPSSKLGAVELRMQWAGCCSLH